jgi:hypothetical protein
MQYGSNLKGVDIGNYRILFPKSIVLDYISLKPSLWMVLSFKHNKFVNVNHKVSILESVVFFVKNY